MHDNRLKVAFLSLPQRTHAVLEYFVASTGQGDFVLSSDGPSEAAVFDFDNHESRHHWEHYHAQFGKPGILLSVAAQHVPLTVWVQKPVTTGSMLEAAVKIKAGAWFLESRSPLADEHSSELRLPPAPQSGSSVQPELELAAQPEDTRAEVFTVPPVSGSLSFADRAEPVPDHQKQSPMPELAREIHAEAKSASPVQSREVPIREVNRFLHDFRGAIRAWLERLSGVFLRAGRSIQNRARLLSRTSSSGVSHSTGGEVSQRGAVALEGSVDGVVSEPDSATSAREDGTAQAVMEQSPVQEPSDTGGGAETGAESKPEPETPDAPMPRIKAAPSPAELADAPRYCGLREDIPGSEIPRTAELFYPYDYYLVSALREAYMVGAKWRSPTRLDLDLGCVIFVPTENRAYLDFPEEALFEQWVVSQPRRHKVRMVGVQEFADFQLRLASLTRLDRFDATLWKLGMTTAKGRLPVGTDVSKVFFLKSWPNMTRFQPSPFSLRIAALWATRGASLLETARILEIPQRYVFAFYNAALATDIVTDDGTAVKRALRRVTKNNARFLNLFKWLRG